MGCGVGCGLRGTLDGLRGGLRVAGWVAGLPIIDPNRYPAYRGFTLPMGVPICVQIGFRLFSLQAPRWRGKKVGLYGLPVGGVNTPHEVL